MSSSPRRWSLHTGEACRCPICGTYRVTRLKLPDQIDRHHSGFLNLLERIAGQGKRYHCRYCRVQFFDRRPMLSELPPDDETETRTPPERATTRPDTAKSGE